MAKLTFIIDGMMCECCVAKIEQALKLDGVTNLSVKIGKAVMNYDESVVTQEKLLAAIIDAGFTAKVKKGLF